MPQASIIIVTRNRRELLARAVESALAQHGDNEVIVVDDGSTDDTAEFVKRTFPSVKLAHFDDQAGYVVRRTQASAMATAPVFFSIDDDAVFADSDVVTDVLKKFEHPRIAAVMIPHLNCAADDKTLWSAPTAPDDRQIYITHTFIGTAYALRREVFGELGGYQPILFHWGEEGEFSQRLLNAGYCIAMETRHRIRHYPNLSGKYNRTLLRYIYRNRVLTLWLNAPLAVLPLLLLIELAYGIKRSVQVPQQKLVALEGELFGFAAIVRNWSRRRGIRLSAYRLWLELRKKPRPLVEVAGRLPPMRAKTRDISDIAWAQFP